MYATIRLGGVNSAIILSIRRRKFYSATFPELSKNVYIARRKEIGSLQYYLREEKRFIMINYIKTFPMSVYIISQRKQKKTAVHDNASVCCLLAVSGHEMTEMAEERKA